MTLAMVGLGAYLWVVHSFKAALAQPALLVGLAAILLGGHRVRVPAVLLWFGAFVVWAAVTFQATTLGDAEVLSNFMKFWLISLVVVNAARTRRQFYTLMVIWLGIFALYPVRGTLINFMIGNSYFGRYAWNFTFGNPNDLSALTLPILAMAVAVLQGQGQARWVKLSAIAGVLVLPLMIMITQSRGGILALATFGLLILMQYRRQARGFALAFLAAGVIYLVAPPDVWNRLAGLKEVGTETAALAQVDEEGSAAQRFEVWKVATAVIWENPVAGVGIGGYPEAHREMFRRGGFEWFAGGGRDTHSLYLNVAAETGIVGFALYMGMLLSVFLGGFKAIRQVRGHDPTAARQIHTLLLGLVAFLQACIFATLNSIPYLYVYIGVLTSAITVLPAKVTVRRGSVQDATRSEGPQSISSDPGVQGLRCALADNGYRASVRFRPG